MIRRPAREACRRGAGKRKGRHDGPLHSVPQRDEVEAQVGDAVRCGAKVLVGGERPDGSSIWTRDLKRARAAADRTDAGYTPMKSLHLAHDEPPIGGVKQSGFGKEHRIEALHGYLEQKAVVLSA